MSGDREENQADPYVLMTAARNEGDYIEQTLQSVVAQDLKPICWVIVSDGSTDDTDALVAQYAREFPFIRLVRRDREEGRNFGGKAAALQLAAKHLAEFDYAYIGALDADVSFEPTYYARAVDRFRADIELGVIGGVRYDNCGQAYRKVLTSKDSAGGPTQFFRRLCYEQIGGYFPLRLGGVDAAAEAMAKMHGWKVRTFDELELRHHRRTGTESRGILGARFRQGIVDRSLGYHPLFALSKCIYRLAERPYILSGIFRGFGFTWAYLRGDKPLTPPELVAFLRQDQMRRLGLRRGAQAPGVRAVALSGICAATFSTDIDGESGAYALVTAARNEGEFIERTIQSVIAQEATPERWVVVSDGSTDDTDAIVKEYAKEYPFIRLIRRDGEVKRDFGGKVFALQEAVKALADVDYAYLGVLDADVSFEPTYYARAMAKFRAEPQLGLIGGVRFDRVGHTYRRVLASMNSAGGPTQFFRRACYEQVGGYLPLRLGGEDAVAEATARMHGWRVRSFEDLVLQHHRRTGTESSGILAARFRQGLVDRSLGNHALFEVGKCIFRLRERPLLLSGIFRMSGYFWAWVCGHKPLAPPEVVAHLRRQQLSRIGLGRGAE